MVRFVKKKCDVDLTFLVESTDFHLIFPETRGLGTVQIECVVNISSSQGASDKCYTNDFFVKNCIWRAHRLSRSMGRVWVSGTNLTSISFEKNVCPFKCDQVGVSGAYFHILLLGARLPI